MTEVEHIYKSTGQYLGFIFGGSFYSRDGQYLGWIEGRFVWDSNGVFRGTINKIGSVGYVLKNTLSVQPIPKTPKTPSPLTITPEPRGNIPPVQLPFYQKDGF